MINVHEKHLLTKARWENHINGYSIVDCVFFENDKVIIISRQDIPEDRIGTLWDTEIKTRINCVTMDINETKCATYNMTGFNLPKCGITQLPALRGLISSREAKGSIYAIGKGGVKEMEYITPQWESNPLTSCTTNKLKCIGGWAYAVSQGRCVYKRTSHGAWEALHNGIVRPEKMSTADMGFADIHGSNENNMYAVGGCGDVWHYNGEKWQWCDFPSNEQLSCVLVAPDGDVYISGEGGNLWRGQMHTWEKIHTGSSSVLNKDLVWYNNQVWVSSDYQLRVWNGKELVRPVHDGKEIIMSGNMDVYENLLLVADLNTVKLFDGIDWRTIVRPYE